VETTLSRVLDLAPAVAKLADETERQRRIPDDLVASLVAAGCYRMSVPASHGGDELPLPEALRVVEALSRADGAVGWTVGQGAVAQVIFSYFPLATFDALFAETPDVAGAGAVAPKGKALRQDGGWRVSGQWPFASGCTHAEWIYVHSVVLGENADGPPEVRLMLFPATEVKVVDTWHVAGLRGTASHDLVVQGFCPDERSCALMNARPSLDRPIYAVPPQSQGGLVIAAVAVGIAQGALDEVAELAAGGRKQSFATSRMATSPLFQDRLGEAAMTLAAARALLYAQAEAAWERARSGGLFDVTVLAPLRATAPEVTAMATRVVDTAYTLGGGAAVYESSPLQRRLRDVHTATQHAINGRQFYGVLGALLAGEEVETAVF
jgi:alkylation response protein AidB-like acyl-CoA dehydrogenase